MRYTIDRMNACFSSCVSLHFFFMFRNKLMSFNAIVDDDVRRLSCSSQGRSQTEEKEEFIDVWCTVYTVSRTEKNENKRTGFTASSKVLKTLFSLSFMYPFVVQCNVVNVDTEWNECKKLTKNALATGAAQRS